MDMNQEDYSQYNLVVRAFDVKNGIYGQAMNDIFYYKTIEKAIDRLQNLNGEILHISDKLLTHKELIGDVDVFKQVCLKNAGFLDLVKRANMSEQAKDDLLVELRYDKKIVGKFLSLYDLNKETLQRLLNLSGLTSDVYSILFDMLSNQLRHDRELLAGFIKKIGYLPVDKIDSDIFEDKEFMMDLVDDVGVYSGYLDLMPHDFLRNDRDFLRLVLQKCSNDSHGYSYSFRRALELSELKNDRDFCISLLSDEKMEHHITNIYLGFGFRCDLEITKLAIEKGMKWHEISSSWLAGWLEDVMFVKFLLERGEKIFNGYFLSNKMLDNKDLAQVAFKHDIYAINHASERVQLLVTKIDYSTPLSEPTYLTLDRCNISLDKLGLEDSRGYEVFIKRINKRRYFVISFTDVIYSSDNLRDAYYYCIENFYEHRFE